MCWLLLKVKTMLEKTVKKLWKGSLVSVRDYEVESAIARGGMIIHLVAGDNVERMFVGRDDLMQHLAKAIQENQKFKSKTGGKNYRLVDIPWKAEKPDTNQEELFNV